MKKSSKYLPDSDASLVIWIVNFVLKLAGYAATLGISSTEVESVTNDSKFFQFVENMVEAYRTMLQNVVNYKNLLKRQIGSQVLGSLPVMPDLGVAPVAVNAGFINRLSKLVKKIKSSPNYTEVIGRDLGIVGPDSPVDLDALMPVLKINLDAGSPRIKAKKGVADGMDVYVDRNDGKGSVFLIRLIKLNFVDLATLPATVKEWKYRGMYVVDNENVGKMSAEVSVMVKTV